MWGRDRNFLFSMMYELYNRETQISLTKVFYCSPFIYFHPLYTVYTNNKCLGFPEHFDRTQYNSDSLKTYYIGQLR